MSEVLNRNQQLSPRAGARALAARGLIAVWQADYKGAIPDLSAALERFERLEDQQGSGYVLTALALIELMSTGAPSAEKRMRAAHQSLLGSGDRWAAVLAMNGLLWGLQVTGQLADSPAEYRAALAEAESVGSPHEIGMAHANLGRYYLYRGSPEEALPHLEEWLDRIASLHHKGTLASALEAVGEAAMLLGNPIGAAQLHGAASALRESIGAAPRETVRERIGRNLARLRTELGEEEFRRACAEGEGLGFDEAVEAARIAAQPARAGVNAA